jgi:pimeloyl-[acyl-carrier protein] synthase
VLQDPRFTSRLDFDFPQAQPGSLEDFRRACFEQQMIFRDDSQQRKVHKLLLRHFAVLTKSHEASIRGLATRLAESLPDDVFDLVSDFAIPFTMDVVGRVVGVPPLDGWEDLEAWSTTFADRTSGYGGGELADIDRLGEHFRALVAEGPTDHDTLHASLVRERVYASDRDLAINLMVVFTAGRITTQKLLTNGVPLLMTEWASLRKTRASDPGVDRRLSEELLRVVTPTRYVMRRALVDVELEHGSTDGHRRVSRGERVAVFYEAANRDEAVFECPHELQPSRNPNPHLAFGVGPHRCPGATVARLEIQAALSALFDRFGALAVEPEKLLWRPNPNLGGYARLMCRGVRPREPDA